MFEIGYHLHSDYWHKGLATEAAKACKKWFFENTDYDEVYSYMNADNIGSYSVAIRNGMKLFEEYINDNYNLYDKYDSTTVNCVKLDELVKGNYISSTTLQQSNLTVDSYLTVHGNGTFFDIEVDNNNVCHN